eukprot:TRINITY_DN1171_c0_g1_i1.p1 TRINITY_DN1171_c0_g1~~TRINITY_DN1171_c0_g1_i1.p1  ORF type:complete len:1225 (-),score=364.55 TRINITY_DN1171_c0_g1_i1:57-3731(-)
MEEDVPSESMEILHSTPRLNIHSLGFVESERAGYHCARYLYPIGYKSSRLFQSLRQAATDVWYISEIRDGGENPRFIVTPTDCPEEAVVADTATGAWATMVQKAMDHKMVIRKTNSVSGPDFFGLTLKWTIDQMVRMPGAEKCQRYTMLFPQEEAVVAAVETVQDESEKETQVEKRGNDESFDDLPSDSKPRLRRRKKVEYNKEIVIEDFAEPEPRPRPPKRPEVVTSVPLFDEDGVDVEHEHEEVEEGIDDAEDDRLPYEYELILQKMEQIRRKTMATGTFDKIVLDEVDEFGEPLVISIPIIDPQATFTTDLGILIGDIPNPRDDHMSAEDDASTEEEMDVEYKIGTVMQTDAGKEKLEKDVKGDIMKEECVASGEKVAFEEPVMEKLKDDGSEKIEGDEKREGEVEVEVEVEEEEEEEEEKLVPVSPRSEEKKPPVELPRVFPPGRCYRVLSNDIETWEEADDSMTVAKTTSKSSSKKQKKGKKASTCDDDLQQLRDSWEFPVILMLLHDIWKVLDFGGEKFDVVDFEEALANPLKSNYNERLARLHMNLILGTMTLDRKEQIEFDLDLNQNIHSQRWTVYMRHFFDRAFPTQEHPLRETPYVDLVPRQRLLYLRWLVELRVDDDLMVRVVDDHISNGDVRAVRPTILGKGTRDCIYWWFGTSNPRVYREIYPRGSRRKAIWETVCTTSEETQDLMKKLRRHARDASNAIEEIILPQMEEFERMRSSRKEAPRLGTRTRSSRVQVIELKKMEREMGELQQELERKRRIQQRKERKGRTKEERERRKREMAERKLQEQKRIEMVQKEFEVWYQNAHEAWTKARKDSFSRSVVRMEKGALDRHEKEMDSGTIVGRFVDPPVYVEWSIPRTPPAPPGGIPFVSPPGLKGSSIEVKSKPKSEHRKQGKKISISDESSMLVRLRVPHEKTVSSTLNPPVPSTQTFGDMLKTFSHQSSSVAPLRHAQHAQHAMRSTGVSAPHSVPHSVPTSSLAFGVSAPHSTMTNPLQIPHSLQQQPGLQQFVMHPDLATSFGSTHPLWQGGVSGPTGTVSLNSAFSHQISSSLLHPAPFGSVSHVTLDMGTGLPIIPHSIPFSVSISAPPQLVDLSTMAHTSPQPFGGHHPLMGVSGLRYPSSEPFGASTSVAPHMTSFPQGFPGYPVPSVPLAMHPPPCVPPRCTVSGITNPREIAAPIVTPVINPSAGLCLPTLREEDVMELQKVLPGDSKRM